ncbi:MAG TPA: BlaI/MecI/CopY family transcriptional regulator [Pseudonocardiaceae bacterium]|jgi:predicted transcriptional regulator|nr:BlaI/MecI/CopY family transcriptional regulator [Pseudonocardiaceae bacterium]
MPVDHAERTRRRAGGELERAVLAVLWHAARPLTSRDVRHELGGDLAYNTVQTTLVRLHDKGLVRRSPDGRAHRYTPTKQAAELTAERMRDLLTEVPDRRSVLLNFVSALDESDERLLRDLLTAE